MQHTTKTLVQSSFGRISPSAAELAARFYKRLFELDPSLRPLFKGDMARQGLKLMSTLRLAISGLDDIGQLRPALARLGQSHLAYGVRDEHYATVGAALLGALEEQLGPEFTPELRAAWAEAYGLLTAAMRAPAP